MSVDRFSKSPVYSCDIRLGCVITTDNHNCIDFSRDYVVDRSKARAINEREVRNCRVALQLESQQRSRSALVPAVLPW